VALTGWGQDSDKQAARAAGFDDHLTKPVDPDQVEAVITKLLGGVAAASGDSDAGDSASRA
jgi:CheY-like chemotaxis protein